MRKKSFFFFLENIHLDPTKKKELILNRTGKFLPKRHCIYCGNEAAENPFPPFVK